MTQPVTPVCHSGTNPTLIGADVDRDGGVVLRLQVGLRPSGRRRRLLPPNATDARSEGPVPEADSGAGASVQAR